VSKPSLGIVVPLGEGEEKGKGKENDDDDIRTPIRPSAKALGKRRVVEVEEPDRKFFTRAQVGLSISFRYPRTADAFNPDDLFYERTDVRDARNHPGQDDSGMSDSDSDSQPRSRPHHQPVHYAYDAVAERTQRLMQQMALVNGVH
jgi:hypothetical protein